MKKILMLLSLLVVSMFILSGCGKTAGKAIAFENEQPIAVKTETGKIVAEVTPTEEAGKEVRTEYTEEGKYVISVDGEKVAEVVTKEEAGEEVTEVIPMDEKVAIVEKAGEGVEIVFNEEKVAEIKATEGEVITGKEYQQPTPNCYSIYEEGTCLKLGCKWDSNSNICRESTTVSGGQTCTSANNACLNSGTLLCLDYNYNLVNKINCNNRCEVGGSGAWCS